MLLRNQILMDQIFKLNINGYIAQVYCNSSKIAAILPQQELQLAIQCAV